MAKTCSACGAESPDQFRFCGFCGASFEVAAHIPSPPEPAPAERHRLVTVIFADLTSYTRTAARADPEEIYLTIRRTLERLAQPVVRLGGRIDRYVGDGFLATFGTPEAHENDPARALMAALDMQQSMQDLRVEAREHLGWDVQLRIGVNLGPVISGQLDTGILRDTSVFGHAVNLAQRLEAAARPGTILVSEAVHRQTRVQFNFLEPVKLQLKGLDKPVIGYEVAGRRQDARQERGLAGRETPLVGRSAECDALIAGLQRMKVERKGMTALVSGEAGVGKSRLVDEILAPLSDHFTMVRTECSPHETSSYALLTSILENLAGILPDDPGPARQQRLNDLLGRAGTLAREIGPALHDLISGQASEALIGDPKQEQRRIHAAVRRLMAWMARRKATLLVLEDLHWADPSSLEALAHIADLVHEAPLALILIARPVVREKLPAALARTDPLHPDDFLDLALSPLSYEEIDRLVTLLISEVALPVALKRSIAERTSGNPLLIEEMVRMLLDEEVIQQTLEGWRVETHWLEVIQKVPDTVNGLILGRYDRLPPSLKSLLDSAAVLGQSFALPLLAAMTEQPESEELRRQLARLEQADFIRRSSGTGAPVYFFRHALMQEAIYQTILQKERRALHLRAAQVIQQMAEDLSVDSVALVGFHLERARSRQASAYLLQAAERAADRYANQEAMDYYQRVQALLKETELQREPAVDAALGLGELLARTQRPEAAREQLEQARRLSLGPPLPAYRLGDIFYQLGLMYALQGQHTEALAAYEAAATALQESPDQNRSFSLSDIEREIGWVMLSLGNMEEAGRRAEKALALAEAQSNSRAVGSVHNLLTAVHYWAGQLNESVAHALKALAVREQVGDVWGTAATQSNLGALYYKLGHWAQAEAFLRQAIFVQQEIGDYHGTGSTWNTLGLLLLDAGRFNEALQCLNQAIEALGEQVQSPALAIRYLNRGKVWLRLGVTVWAVSDLERGLDAAIRLKNEELRALILSLLAEARLAGNELLTAQELIEQARGTIDEAGASPETRAEVLRVWSAVLRAAREWDASLAANAQARQLFEQIGNRYEVARLQIKAAEIQLARREAGGDLDTETLQSRLLKALSTFRELHAQADVALAEDLLAKISSLVAPGDQGDWRAGQRPVVVASIKLLLPTLAEEEWEHQEKLAEALNALTAVLRKIGVDHGAAVTTSGAGLAYVLEAPEASEAGNLALKAIQCALATIDAAVRQNRASRRQYGFEIPVGIGLDAGNWQDAADDPSRVGVFVSVSQTGRGAEATAALASPNQIFVTSDIARLVRGAYDLEAFEHHADARLGGPVYRIGRAKSDAPLRRALPGSSRQLIGRQAETDALRQWVDRLRGEPRGLVCYLEAEAGMGKTRLLEQTLAYAQPEALCLLGKCESFRSGISYWALIDILERARVPETAASQRLKSLLGLRPPDEADYALLTSLPPAHLRQELFGRVREFLLQEASRQPVLIAVEDIHWLDLSSLDLVDFLLSLTLQARISIMLVARAEMPGPHRALVTKAERVCRDRYQRVSFAGLTRRESVTLCHDLLGTDALPLDLWTSLEPFAGHPLSLEEALRFLVERGWLWESEGRWQLADLENAPDRRMPAAFKDLLHGRMDILRGETLHVLQAAAVLGETFDRTVLSQIIPSPALSQYLTELGERGWLLPPKPESPLAYRFRHTLTREMIYATLLTSKKQVLHQRAGEAIESLYPEAQEENLELLAYHFGNSSLREKALHYLVRAAEKSFARHALAESLDYHQRARELVERNPQLQQPRWLSRIALGLADVHLALGEPASAAADSAALLDQPSLELSPELRAGALRRLGTARRHMGNYSAALEQFQAALAALAKSRESSQPLPGAKTDPGERERLVVELEIAQTMFAMRENEPAQAQAQRVLDALDRRQHPELAAEALNLVGGILYRQGEYDPASRAVQESLSIYQMYGNRSGAAAAYANLGLLDAQRQEIEAAYDHLALSLSIREALGDSAGIAIARNNLGQLEKNRGQFAEALYHLQVAVETARNAELSQWLAQSLANLGHVLVLLGQTGEASTALLEAETLCRSYQFRNLLCEVLWKRADGLIETSQLEAAEECALSALKLATELGSHDLRSEAQRALGRVYRKQTEFAGAIEATGAAWQARMNDPSPVMRARFAAEHALALYGGGRAQEAARLLDEFVNPAKLVESSSILHEITEALAPPGG